MTRDATAVSPLSDQPVEQGRVGPVPQSLPAPQRGNRVEVENPPHTAIRIAIAVALLAVAGFAVWRVFLAAPAVPVGIVAVSGRIDGDDAAVASKAGGRILNVRVREGDSLKAGEIIAVLDDEQVRAREDQARAALARSEAAAKAAQDQIGVLQQQLRQTELQTAQALVDAKGRVKQAEADVAAAEADLARQRSSYQLALFDKEAYGRLAQTGAVSERQGRQAASTADEQAAAVAAAERRVEAGRGALASAQAALTNPDIHAAQTLAIRKQIAQQGAEVTSATAQTEQARAQLAEAHANRQDLVVKAPFEGTVITRTAEPGEVVMAGTPVVTILDLRDVYLRGFIPEGQIGTVKVGQAARVYLDSNPNQPIDAYVSRIDPQAAFTPENTYFRDDRVKQVVGVKLQIKGAVGLAKPGMPADGEILTQGNTWPSGSRRR